MQHAVRKLANVEAIEDDWYSHVKAIVSYLLNEYAICRTCFDHSRGHQDYH